MVQRQLDSLVINGRRLFQDLMVELPVGCASFSIQEVPIREGGGLIVSITPNSPSGAKISARLEDESGVYLFFGEGAVYEVPPKGGRYTDNSCMEEVRALCLAVINGHFEETVWKKDSEVVKSVAKIRLGDRIVPGYWRQLFTNPFKKKEKKHLTYSSYY